MKSSELSRNSAEVFKAAEHGPVTITRRDGEPLVLATAAQRDREREALAMAADLIAASLAPADVPFVERLTDRFPWLKLLPVADRDGFAIEVVDVARACAAVRDFEPFLNVVHAWYETAAFVAAGYPRSDYDWTSSDRAVERPA